MGKLTFTMENYLEAIYELDPSQAGARVSDIAKRLGVTKASTNRAMSTLAEKGLIINEKYKEVFLTEEGHRIAQSTAMKHRVIKEFFVRVLNIDVVVADEDACAIEHVISNASIEAMQCYLEQNKQ